MSQADQNVGNVTFPAFRTELNDNLVALFSQSSGNSAPSTKVPFQSWINTNTTPAKWMIYSGNDSVGSSGWIEIGTINTSTGLFTPSGLTAIANGGTGATTAAAALAALLPSQTGNSGKALTTNGTAASWGTIAVGASIQVFTSSGTYTPTAGKTSFLVFCTGGGGGGGANYLGYAYGGAGGGGGTALRLYTSAELGSTATITVGTGGGVAAAGGTSSFAPTGSGLTISGLGGGGGGSAYSGSGGAYFNGSGGGGGGDTNSMFSIAGNYGAGGSVYYLRGITFWGGGRGAGGYGGSGAGTAGVVVILEW